MGILNSIVEKWRTDPRLIEIADAERVVVGPPIIGWPVPMIAFQGYTRAKTTRTSKGRIDTVSLTIIIVATTADEVDAVASNLVDRLTPVDLPNGVALREWISSTLIVTRDETSEQYTGQLQLDCHLW